MNFFEDLVVELKEENLLEDTVIDLARNESDGSNVDVDLQGRADNNAKVGLEQIDPLHDVSDRDDVSTVSVDNIEFEVAVAESTRHPAEDPESGSEIIAPTSSVQKPKDEREFYIKQASSEVSSLQMVEHVLSAVEREYQKKLPKAFDDLDVKKALNAFIQVTGSPDSDEHKQCEIALLSETEAWCSALAARDREISVADLRRYCENCRPMLSSQAMLSLARFYRNLPYSESVRGKFDFIITRLFSRPMEDQSRKLLFTSDEMLGHIQKLYAEWSSLALFSVEDPESNIKLAVLSFQDLSLEAEKATEFDELIKSDFFNRLRLFKESIADLFYAPSVTVAAIESNVRVGNVYVELIDRERRRSSAASVHEKYSFVDDATVSDATGRTLDLFDVLRQRPEALQSEPVIEPRVEEHVPNEEVAKSANGSKDVKVRRKWLPNIGLDNLGVSKWLLVAGTLLIAVSVGLYIWANFFIVEPPSSAGVTNYDLTSSPFREDLKLAKVSGETFYGVLQPSWETMTKEKQQELVQKIYQTGAGKNWMKVNLMNSQGKTVAFMSATRSDIISPLP